MEVPDYFSSPEFEALNLSPAQFAAACQLPGRASEVFWKNRPLWLEQVNRQLAEMDAPSDFSVHDNGSIVLVKPLTEAAREWIQEFVRPEGWQWFGNALAVEPRYLEGLLAGIGEAGLRV